MNKKGFYLPFVISPCRKIDEVSQNTTISSVDLKHMIQRLQSQHS